MEWQTHAEDLATGITHSGSRWIGPVAATARHELVPHWWTRTAAGWRQQTGPSDTEKWLRAAYADTTLVTQVGPLHADHAEPGQRASGTSTSSATDPRLTVRMYRHARIGDRDTVLDVVGSGYGTELLCRRLTDQQVTAVDVDPYLIKAAGQRLQAHGLQPELQVCDISGPLPGQYDRIVSTVSVRKIPVSWLRALRPGGRFVTTITGTALIITADKAEDGGAVGRVELDTAGFMAVRAAGVEDYPEDAVVSLTKAMAQAVGEVVSTGSLPVLDVEAAWPIWSALEIQCPGIRHRYDADGAQRTAWMYHADGSWACAVAPGNEPPEVHQGGPRRLWDELDRIRRRLVIEGSLPLFGSKVTVTPDGETTFSRGRWSAAL